MIHRQLNVQVSWVAPKVEKKKPKTVESVAQPTSRLGVEAPLTWDIELEEGKAASKKTRRSARRKQQRREHPSSSLRMASVSKQTQKKYREIWSQLCKWNGGRVTTGLSLHHLDQLVTSYLEDMYLEGEDLSKANYLVAAIAFFIPQCKGLSALPISQQSMKGWRKLCPPRSRMPLPYEVVCLLSLTAFQQGLIEVSLILLLIFFLYLRPSEAFRLRVQDLVPPPARAKRPYKNFSVLLHPTELGVPSQTLQWDEMMELDLDHQRFLGQALQKHLQLGRRNKDSLAFTATLPEVNEFVAGQWMPLKLQSLGAPHLYRLRHGGASYDAAMRHRTVAEIQSRGRWQTLKSVKNYEKGSRLTQLFSGLPKETQRAATKAKEKIGSVLLSRR